MNIKKLEDWYLTHHRDLPFRQTKDPYQIWVSEIMLQQTQVETVLPFFKTFIKKYPTIYDLAQSFEDDLKKDVEGLGYYQRFKNMRLTAQKVVKEHHGQIPNHYQELIQLPGIGPYTAGAILSIAYDQPISAVDGNVIRVLSRYYNLNDDFSQVANKKRLNDINQSLIEKARPSIYTQALMELGALVCRPKKPQCGVCPLQDQCEAFKLGIQESLPTKKVKPIKKKLHYFTFLLFDNKGELYVRQRTEKLLEGMYEYPQFLGQTLAEVLEKNANYGITILQKEGMYHHEFTHLSWKMSVYSGTVQNPNSSWHLVTPKELLQLPMAVAHRKIAIKKGASAPLTL
ncbi:MAG: A/G-specific adenine glycosylase [Acholeplasmataceae bacterium]|nr:A/G-specific adenine glycosylase [Acholeplasmataceae bacterium]